MFVRRLQDSNLSFSFFYRQLELLVLKMQFPSLKIPHFNNEAKYNTFLVKIHFYIIGFQLALV